MRLAPAPGEFRLVVDGLGDVTDGPVSAPHAMASRTPPKAVPPAAGHLLPGEQHGLVPRGQPGQLQRKDCQGRDDDHRCHASATAGASRREPDQRGDESEGRLPNGAQEREEHVSDHLDLLGDPGHARRIRSLVGRDGRRHRPSTDGSDEPS